LVLSGGLNVIIDSVFASNLIGPDAMAVTGLYTPLAKILDTINALMFGGAQILCGKYLGENVLKKARGIFTIDVFSISIIAVIATMLFELFPQLPAAFCVKPGNELTPDLIDYIRGVAFGILPFLLSTQLTAFLQLEKQEKRGYFAIGSMFLTNALCDYIFIEIFDMGIFGLGLATSIANWVSFLIQASYYLRKDKVFGIDTKDLSISYLIDTLRFGMPSAGTQLLLAIRGILLNQIILSNIGNDGLTAFAAVGSLGYVYWAIPAGVTTAMMSLASVYAGERDKSAIRLLVRVFFRRALPLVCAAAALLSAMAWPLAKMYFHSAPANIFNMTLIGLFIFPWYTPFSSIGIGFLNLWRCMDYKKGVNVLIVVDGLIYVLLFSEIFSNLFAMNGIWIAQIVSCIAVAATAYIMGWIYNRHAPKSLNELCCFPENFGIDEDKRLDISIHSMDEVINISERVVSFCKAQGVDRKTSMHAGLCIEELAGNIVKHGFSKKSNSVVDISVIHADDSLSIQLKDNCRPFDPTEQMKIFTPDDPTHNIGIRLISKVSKKMEYRTLLGLNVISIKL